MTTYYGGTSGFSYKEWIGPFYPPGTKNADMLAVYAESLPSVEINNTFYRMPRKSVVAQWHENTPTDFRFAIKASRRITHSKKLVDTAETVGYLTKALEPLGEKLGVVLFQLPPYFALDLDVLNAFVKSLPKQLPAAFEFRHASWQCEAVLDCLAPHNAAVCVSDTSDTGEDLPHSGSFGYLRLRQSDYSGGQLKSWAKRINQSPWESVFVFFKHEAEGAAPRMARQFMDLAST